MFTDKQLADFRAYERVRKGGSYNMIGPRAIRASGLSKEDYYFVLKNYGKLADAIDEQEKEEENT